jgi:hypothetical protein
VEASTIQQEQQQPICFLDHAWGAVSPRVLLKALERLVGLQQLGNPTWDLVFGQIMPQVSCSSLVTGNHQHAISSSGCMLRLWRDHTTTRQAL